MSLQGQKVEWPKWDFGSIYTFLFSSSTPSSDATLDILNDWDEQNSKQTESKFSYVYT